MPLYQAFGLRIQSIFPLPGAQLAAEQEFAAEDAAELLIVEGHPALLPSFRSAGPYRLTDGSLVFTMPGVAQYHCTLGGTRITVDPFPGASRDELSLMLIATAIPAALWMQGEIVLHAATVILPGQDRAVALVGASGSGKSSWLERLVSLGSQVVGDDTLCLRVHGETVDSSGLPGCVFLRSQAAAQSERSALSVPATSQRPNADLGCIVVLEHTGEGGSSGFARLFGAAPLAALLKSRHRPTVPALLGYDAGLLGRFAEIARLIPVYSASSQTTHLRHSSESFASLRSLLQQHGTGSEGELT